LPITGFGRRRSGDDDFEKSPDAALRFILRRCGVRLSTPHSSGFARLACGAFFEVVEFEHLYDFLRVHQDMKEIRIGVIGGTRGMGRWFARFLRKQGFAVAVCDETTKLTPAKLSGSCDVVVVSVPIGITVEIIRAIGPLLHQESLLMDLASLKAAPVEAMLKYSRSEVIGCHPLFGPQVRSIRGRHIALCPARTKRWLPWLRSVLQAAGARIVETTPEEHDRSMALVQGLNHLNSLALGVVLSGADASLSDLAPFSTPVFQEKLNIAEKVFRPNPRLYAEVMVLNPDMEQVVALYEQTLSDLKMLIRKKDTAGLIALIGHHASRLWPAR
jgi:prephenate dehydrogenase